MLPPTQGCKCIPPRPPTMAIEILDQYPIDIVVTDLHVPEIGELELLTEGGTQCMPIVPIQIVERLSTIAKAV
jgi:DNA-binding NtrC family response regulator